MLFNLSIENVALIKKTDINFNNGFNVLTGETGAGKSILIGSLNMLLGERISRDLIRTGEDYAYVEGIFYITDTEKDCLGKLDVYPDYDNSLILSRKVSADGKNICKAGGKTVSVSLLRDIGRALVNIHGQHDNQALLDNKTHISFLDAYIPKEEKNLFANFKALYEEYKDLCDKLLNLDIDENERARKLDILSFEIDEIEKAQLVPGEENELKDKKNVLKNRENLVKNLNLALDALYENHDGECAYNLFETSKRAVENVSLSPEFEKITEKMNDILYDIEDVRDMLREKLDKINYEDFNLDEIEERLDVIFKLKRKYGGSEESVLSYLENAQNELESLNLHDSNLSKIKEKLNAVLNEINAILPKITALRKKYAAEIEKKICAELNELNMENAVFSVSFEKCELSKKGADKVEFLLSANVGEPMLPLSKIVSGGELSRIMLALKNVLSMGDVADTLIFDEIDTGISGRAAGKVGEKLCEISGKKQVLCVTHLPQIAAKSDHHFKTSKSEENGKTLTTIKEIKLKEKIDEIALMIGGDTVSDITLKQAEEMINKKA